MVRGAARLLVVVAMIASASVAVPARAEAAGSCGGVWMGASECSFVLQSDGVYAAGLAISRTVEQTQTPAGKVPLSRFPFLSVDVVWRHTLPTGEVRDDVLFGCIITGFAGVPAAPCAAQSFVGVPPGTELVCKAHGRDLGAYSCASTPHLALP